MVHLPARPARARGLALPALRPRGLRRRRKYRENPAARPPSLEEFLGDPRFRNLQTRRIAGAEDAELAKREIRERYLMVGLTERFEDSIRLLAKRSPHPIDLRFRRLEVAPRTELEQANEREQALYERVRDVWFPRPLQRAGDLSHLATREIGRPTARYQLSRGWNRGVYQLALRARARLNRRAGA